MMNSAVLKKLLPHLAAYLIMLVISFAFYSPAAFEGKVLNQYDNNQATASQQEARFYENQDGQIPQWTNSMFGGMPTYQIWFKSKNNLTRFVYRGFLLFQSLLNPHIATLLMMFGVYLFLMVLGADWRIGLLGGIAFGLSAYGAVWTHAGHSIKVIAIAFIAPIFAGVILTFRGKLLLGGALTALFLSLQILANHLQITYYTFFVLMILGMVFLIDAIRNNTLPQFGKATGVLVVAGILALGTSATRLWTTYEYGEETIRGKSELVDKQESSGGTAAEGGLSKSYAFQYSYGILETYNLLIPRFMGGQSSKFLFQDRNTATAKVLGGMGQQANNYVRASSQYWGTQSSAAPAYMGAIVIFLFFLGVVLVKGPLKWWLVAGTILTIMMSWGSNFPILNYTLFDYFPMYNKFRAVNMMLSMSNLLIVVLAAMGLQAFFKSNVSSEVKKKGLYIAGGISAGLCLLALILSGAFDYGTSAGNLPDQLAIALIKDRSGLLRSDALRSLGLILAGLIILWAALKSKLKPMIAVGLLVALVTVDNWSASRRVVGPKDFISKRQLASADQPSAADKQILADKDLDYRVADFSKGGPFANGLTSFHHKSIGGYHAAKLMRIQEVIERYLGNPNTARHIYGMLNVKYFIQQGDQVVKNPDALGNAWFVKSIKTVKTGDEEIAALQNFQPKNEALVQEKYANSLKGWQPQADPTASIKLTKYHPDRMEYTYSANSDQLAVFSEVYYPPSKGWKMYLDGKPYQDFTKVDYLLRGLKVPAGQNRKLVMEFHPKSFYTGEWIALISSLLTLLLVGFAIWKYLSSNPLPAVERLSAVTSRSTLTPVQSKKGKKKK